MSGSIFAQEFDFTANTIGSTGLTIIAACIASPYAQDTIAPYAVPGTNATIVAPITGCTYTGQQVFVSAFPSNTVLTPQTLGNCGVYTYTPNAPTMTTFVVSTQGPLGVGCSWTSGPGSVAQKKPLK